MSDAATDGATPTSQCTALEGDDYRELQVGGVARRYLVHVPRSARPNTAPLVVDLHGLLTHAAFERATSGFAALADAEGFVVAYPEAIDAAWSLSDDSCCSIEPVDDVEFMRELVAAIKSTGCIDPQRVYAVGVSAGGGLAQQLACRAADVFAAVTTREFDLLSTISESCQPSRPIAVLALRDPADTAIPYSGGDFRPVTGLNRTFKSIGAAASLQRWAALNQCTGDSEPIGPSCRGYAACGGGTAVESCTRPAADAADALTAWQFLSRFRSQ